MPEASPTAPRPATSRGAALVTGAGRGIGLAAASALAAAGRRVALAARTESEISAAARALDARHGAGTALAVACDVTDAPSVDRAAGRAEEALGPIDAVVLASGIAESAPYLATGDDLLGRHLEVNLLGAHRVMRRVLPGMLGAGEGRIVAIASTAGLGGHAYVAAYAASKHALVGLVRSASLETAPKGVRINALCPGYVDTAMIEPAVARVMKSTGKSREEAREVLASLNPSGRLLSPEEVAAGVIWLVEGDGRGLSGEAIVVDGLTEPWRDEPPLPVNPIALGKASGYSNGLAYRSGRTLYVAGQVAWDAAHQIVGGDDFAAQFGAALGNVLAVVREAGGSAERIARLRIYVADRERYLASLREIGAAYRRLMGRHYPAMALVEARRLLEEGALVEIEAEAHL